MTRLPRLAAALIIAVIGAGVAGCDHSDGPSPALRGLDNNPVTTNPHQVSARRGDLHDADFELASGATTVVVHSEDLGDALYRITTPDGAGLVPSAVVSDDHVVAQLSSSGVNGPSIVDIALSDAVAWTIHLDGGATEANVDMKKGGLASLDFGAGVTRIDASLPDEDGTIGVRMAGGASEFTVHAAAGVPARVTMGGGGGSATIDGTGHTGIAGGTVYTADGWDSAKHRIDIDNTAGVSTFVLDRY